MKHIKKIMFGTYLLFNSITLPAFITSWKETIKGKEYSIEYLDEGTLSQDKDVCLKSFSKAYESIPLQELQISNLTTFLEEAFQNVEEDFKFKKDNFYYVHIKDNNNVVGFIAFEKEPSSNDSCYIRLLAVDPLYWGNGIGKTLTLSIIPRIHSNIKRLYLSTRKANTQGRKFYEKIGFKETEFKHSDPTINSDLYVGYEYTLEQNFSHNQVAEA